MFSVSESGQPRQPLDRRFMAEELNIEEDRHSSQVYVITQNSPPDLTHLTVLYGYCTDIDEYWDLEGSKFVNVLRYSKEGQ